VPQRAGGQPDLEHLARQRLADFDPTSSTVILLDGPPGERPVSILVEQHRYAIAIVTYHHTVAPISVRTEL
jgi:hypothetical protein